MRSALYTDSLHALPREPSYACAMFYAIAKMPNNFVTSPVLLRRPTLRLLDYDYDYAYDYDYEYDYQYDYQYEFEYEYD